MKHYAIVLGFALIGVIMLGLSAVLFMHMRSETRIGERLIEEGVAVEALVVTAEFVERLSCRGGTIKACQRSDYARGEIVFLVNDRRAVHLATLSQAEFDAFEAGEEVRIPIIYLPDDPLEIEAERGDRYSNAQGDILVIFVAAAFGLTFAVIGGIAALIIRKRPPD